MIGVAQRILIFCAISLLSVVSIAPLSAAMAAGAPAQLYNKTIDIFWGENSSNKRVPDGVVVNGTTRLQLLVYISSAGRPFVRFARADNRNSRTSEIGPEVAGGHVNFQGNTLVMAAEKNGVARQVTVSFDAGFTGCTAAVMSGKTGASPRWKGLDGVPYEVLSINVGSATCSMQEGNAVGH